MNSTNHMISRHHNIRYSANAFTVKSGPGLAAAVQRGTLCEHSSRGTTKEDGPEHVVEVPRASGPRNFLNPRQLEMLE